MKILAFSDWRSQPIEMLVEIVRTHRPDVILYAGDDMDRFISPQTPLLLKTTKNILELSYPELKPIKSEQKRLLSSKAKKALQHIDLLNDNVFAKLGIPCYYVYGNDDFVLSYNGMYYTRVHNGQFVTTRGDRYRIVEDEKGEITTKYSSPIFDLIFENHVSPDSGIYAKIEPALGEFEIVNSRERVTVYGVACEYGLVNRIKNPPKAYADIFLSHLPPLGILDLSKRFGVDHIGSKRLLNAVRKYQPRLVICGHSHMWGGYLANIGSTTVINVSSHDDDPRHGNYALIDTEDWSIQLNTKEYKNLYMLPGMRSFLRHLDEVPDCIQPRKPCKTTKELLNMLRNIEKSGVDTTRVKERIRSLEWSKPRVQRQISFNPNLESYVDVETGLAEGNEPGRLWLVGLWHQGELRQFHIPEQKNGFLAYLKKGQIHTLVSWTAYDRKALRMLLGKAGAQIYFIDACQRARNCVVWHTYRLHELHSALFGREPSDEPIQGFAAGLYADHLIFSKKVCPHCPSKEEVIEKIKERNKKDILLMIDVCKKLWES